MAATASVRSGPPAPAPAPGPGAATVEWVLPDSPASLLTYSVDGVSREASWTLREGDRASVVARVAPPDAASAALALVADELGLPRAGEQSTVLPRLRRALDDLVVGGGGGGGARAPPPAPPAGAAVGQTWTLRADGVLRPQDPSATVTSAAAAAPQPAPGDGGLEERAAAAARTDAAVEAPDADAAAAPAVIIPAAPASAAAAVFAPAGGPAAAAPAASAAGAAAPPDPAASPPGAGVDAAVVAAAGAAAAASAAASAAAAAVEAAAAPAPAAVGPAGGGAAPVAAVVVTAPATWRYPIMPRAAPPAPELSGAAALAAAVAAASPSTGRLRASLLREAIVASHEAAGAALLLPLCVSPGALRALVEAHPALLRLEPDVEAAAAAAAAGLVGDAGDAGVVIVCATPPPASAAAAAAVAAGGSGTAAQPPASATGVGLASAPGFDAGLFAATALMRAIAGCGGAIRGTDIAAFNAAPAQFGDRTAAIFAALRRAGTPAKFAAAYPDYFTVRTPPGSRVGVFSVSGAMFASVARERAADVAAGLRASFDAPLPLPPPPLVPPASWDAGGGALADSLGRGGAAREAAARDEAEAAAARAIARSARDGLEEIGDELHSTLWTGVVSAERFARDKDPSLAPDPVVTSGDEGSRWAVAAAGAHAALRERRSVAAVLAPLGRAGDAGVPGIGAVAAVTESAFETRELALLALLLGRVDGGGWFGEAAGAGDGGGGGDDDDVATRGALYTVLRGEALALRGSPPRHARLSDRAAAPLAIALAAGARAGATGWRLADDGGGVGLADALPPRAAAVVAEFGSPEGYFRAFPSAYALAPPEDGGCGLRVAFAADFRCAVAGLLVTLLRGARDAHVVAEFEAAEISRTAAASAALSRMRAARTPIALHVRWPASPDAWPSCVVAEVGPARGPPRLALSVFDFEAMREAAGGDSDAWTDAGVGSFLSDGAVLKVVDGWDLPRALWLDQLCGARGALRGFVDLAAAPAQPAAPFAVTTPGRGALAALLVATAGTALRASRLAPGDVAGARDALVESLAAALAPRGWRYACQLLSHEAPRRVWLGAGTAAYTPPRPGAAPPTPLAPPMCSRAGEWDALLAALPAGARGAFAALPGTALALVTDVVLAVGRPPVVWLAAPLAPGGPCRLRLCTVQPLSSDELKEVEDALAPPTRRPGEGLEERAPLPRTLCYAVGARNRAGRVVRVTLRVGRVVPDALRLVSDVLVGAAPGDPPGGGTLGHAMRRAPGHALVVGAPRTGKTTLLRELARTLAGRGERVFVVDTLWELGGPGPAPHWGIGASTWLRVGRGFGDQAEVLARLGDALAREPDGDSVVIIIDEIEGAADEAAAAAVVSGGSSRRLVAGARAGSIGALRASPGGALLMTAVGGVVDVVVETRRPAGRSALVVRSVKEARAAGWDAEDADGRGAAARMPAREFGRGHEPAVIPGELREWCPDRDGGFVVASAGTTHWAEPPGSRAPEQPAAAAPAPAIAAPEQPAAPAPAIAAPAGDEAAAPADVEVLVLPFSL